VKDEGGNNRDEFLTYFKYAVIVTTSSQPHTRNDGKMLIRQMLKIEKFIEESAHLAFSFHYPITCPFCLPADCREKEGKCMNPVYTRPSPKEFNINLSKTLANVKIKDISLSTLIFVK
jgi:predicted metal-binding protein